MADPSTPRVTSYNDLLPASRRTLTDEVETPTLELDFLRQELGVKRLNDVHDWLWLAGRPMPSRPLYHQKALQRDFVIHQQTDLHLVWDSTRIFLKPVPRYLLNQQFWQDHLTCERGCGSTPISNGFSRRDGKGEEKETETAQNDVEAASCERCEVHQYALGFMLSYASLISYENDLHIAKTVNLVPSELTWLEWRAHVKILLDMGKRRRVNKRYIFGELRLDRLNQIYRYSFRSPLRGYFGGYNSYSYFWRKNLVRIASVFAYLVVILSAMQVGLATDGLRDSFVFQQVSYGFTVFSILAPLVFTGLVFVVFFAIFLFNLNATRIYWKKRQERTRHLQTA